MARKNIYHVLFIAPSYGYQLWINNLEDVLIYLFLKIPTYSWSFVFNILNVLHSLIGPVSSLSRAPVFLFLVHSRHVNNLQLGHFRYFSAMANWIQFHDFQVSELDIWVLKWSWYYINNLSKFGDDHFYMYVNSFKV